MFLFVIFRVNVEEIIGWWFVCYIFMNLHVQNITILLKYLQNKLIKLGINILAWKVHEKIRAFWAELLNIDFLWAKPSLKSSTWKTQASSFFELLITLILCITKIKVPKSTSQEPFIKNSFIRGDQYSSYVESLQYFNVDSLKERRKILCLKFALKAYRTQSELVVRK